MLGLEDSLARSHRKLRFPIPFEGGLLFRVAFGPSKTPTMLSICLI